MWAEWLCGVFLLYTDLPNHIGNQRLICLPLSLQAGKPSAAAEARAWQQNAAAWAERLRTAFPLYADLLQPLALAALEVSAGLALLADAAEARAGGGEGAGTGVVVAELMAFPPLLAPALKGAESKLRPPHVYLSAQHQHPMLCPGGCHDTSRRQV